MEERAAGILLHLTSLPGPHGSGDLGAEARAFVSALANAEQRWWQMLPVGPCGYGDSPYSALSAFAGNPLLVDLDALGIPIDAAAFDPNTVDFAAVTAFRERHLRRAFDVFRAAKPPPAFEAFVANEAHWLEDYALFDALKRAHGGRAWIEWAPEVRLRERAALERARAAHADAIAFVRFVQWQFAEQWASLRRDCHARGVGLVGDIPIFVAHDSADVWQHREWFDLDASGLPVHVAGVPPDYFSATGQRWGNPLYRWRKMAATGFDFWVRRFRTALARFDAIRLDHFIGFARYWRIPANEPTAENGRWMVGPGRALFDAVESAIGSLPLVAEDLGAVTPKVTRLRRDLGLPGIRLLQFAFGTDPQAATFLPHNHERAAVVYTGTHDNDTTVSWFAGLADDERRAVLAYLGLAVPAAAGPGGVIPEPPGGIVWPMIRLAMQSVARTAILPLQDVLGLGGEARMNLPGTPSGNWRWRMGAGSFDVATQERLRDLTRVYGRSRGARGARSAEGK